MRAHEAQREGSYRGGKSERTRARRGMSLSAEPSSTERVSLSPLGISAAYRVPGDVDGVPSTKAGMRSLTTKEADIILPTGCHEAAGWRWYARASYALLARWSA